MINIPIEIISYINNQIFNGNNANIIIAGCSCSGKTTLSNELKEKLDGKGMKVNIISQDSFFKDLDDIPKSEKGVLADDINAFHINEYLETVRNLLFTGIAYIPIYDLSINKRTENFRKACLENINVNIFEGLHSIHILNNSFEAMKVFMDISLNTCLNRRIARDKKDWNIAERYVRRYWEECIKPVTKEQILNQKEFADFLITE